MSSYHKDQNKEKVLTKAEAEECMERLYERAKEDARRKEEKRKATLSHPPGRLPAKHLTQAEIDDLTQRMYEKQLEHQRLKREKNEKQREKEAIGTRESKPLSEEELADSVARMYTQQKDIRETNLKRLTKKYHSMDQPKEHHKISRDQEKAMADRLAAGWKDKKAESRKKIFDKYIVPMDQKFSSRKITDEELQEMATRLYTTGGGHNNAASASGSTSSPPSSPTKGSPTPTKTSHSKK